MREQWKKSLLASEYSPNKDTLVQTSTAQKKFISVCQIDRENVKTVNKLCGHLYLCLINLKVICFLFCFVRTTSCYDNTHVDPQRLGTTTDMYEYVCVCVTPMCWGL